MPVYTPLVSKEERMSLHDRRRRVNIKDVARLAGVSPTTVSHALGGQRPVSAVTREKVLDAVRELGYRPHPGARSLKASGTGVIALCVEGATGESPLGHLGYYFRLMESVTEVAHEEGYALVVVPSHGSDQYLARLLVDGAIVADPIPHDPTLAFLRAQRLPCVTIGRDPDAPEQGHWVRDDSDLETRAMLDHLADGGARRPALVTWMTAGDWVQTALAAYRSWCDEHGVKPYVEAVDPNDEDPMGSAAARLLERPDRPDAVYGLYELPAVAVLRRAPEFGVRVPQDLMVAGPMDFRHGISTRPPMTTLDYDIETQGRTAARMLIRLVRGEPVERPRTTIPHRIVVRASTQP
jgi:DNA-binding LacI/PurR family transcriptional regulator